MPRWTRTDQNSAINEGWRIMFGQIVKNLARSELADNDFARDFVMAKAAAGSKLHRKAVEIEKFAVRAN